MASLLTLPREIRDEILHLVITTPCNNVPEDIETPGERTGFKDHSYHKVGVKHLSERSAYQSDSSSLLLTNRQLHDETAAELESRRSGQFALDIMIVQERELWPTWTCIPSHSIQHVDSVYATFRIFGPPAPRSRSLFKGGDGGPPPMTMLLLAVLNRFLSTGAVGKTVDEGYCKDRRFTIKTLYMDFLTPTYLLKDVTIAPVTPSGLAVELFETNYHRRMFTSVFDRTSSPTYVLNPVDVARWVRGWLDQLQGYTESYGKLFCRRVGEVRFLVDGREDESMRIRLKRYEAYMSNLQKRTQAEGQS